VCFTQVGRIYPETLRLSSCLSSTGSRLWVQNLIIQIPLVLVFKFKKQSMCLKLVWKVDSTCHYQISWSESLVRCEHLIIKVPCIDVIEASWIDVIWSFFPSLDELLLWNWFKYAILIDVFIFSVCRSTRGIDMDTTCISTMMCGEKARQATPSSTSKDFSCSPQFAYYVIGTNWWMCLSGHCSYQLFQ
jgi:hypothetical protein